MFIKEGQMDELSKLLIMERKYIQSVSQLEEKRQEAIDQFVMNENIKLSETTVTQLLNYLQDGLEKNQLEKSVVHLVEIIIQLKEKEQFNQELIQQSMQFVQMSLDMLQPMTKNINYDDNRTEKKAAQNRTMFDSQA